MVECKDSSTEELDRGDKSGSEAVIVADRRGVATLVTLVSELASKVGGGRDCEWRLGGREEQSPKNMDAEPAFGGKSLRVRSPWHHKSGSRDRKGGKHT